MRSRADALTVWLCARAAKWCYGKIKSPVKLIRLTPRSRANWPAEFTSMQSTEILPEVKEIPTTHSTPLAPLPHPPLPSPPPPPPPPSTSPPSPSSPPPSPLFPSPLPNHPSPFPPSSRPFPPPPPSYLTLPSSSPLVLVNIAPLSCLTSTRLDHCLSSSLPSPPPRNLSQTTTLLL